MNEANVIRLDHVAVYCEDFAAMKAFFAKYFHTVADEEHVSLRSGQTNCFLNFPDGRGRIELMSYLGEPSEAHGRLSHLALGVGSEEAVDRLTQMLKNDGYEVLSEPRHTGDGYYESSVKIPEGLHLEITV